MNHFSMQPFFFQSKGHVIELNTLNKVVTVFLVLNASSGCTLDGNQNLVFSFQCYLFSFELDEFMFGIG